MKNLPEYFNCRMVCPVFSFVFCILKWAGNGVIARSQNTRISWHWSRMNAVCVKGHSRWHTTTTTTTTTFLTPFSSAVQSEFNIGTDTCTAKHFQSQHRPSLTELWQSGIFTFNNCVQWLHFPTSNTRDCIQLPLGSELFCLSLLSLISFRN